MSVAPRAVARACRELEVIDLEVEVRPSPAVDGLHAQVGVPNRRLERREGMAVTPAGQTAARDGGPEVCCRIHVLTWPVEEQLRPPDRRHDGSIGTPSGIKESPIFGHEAAVL
jgi:hypothetical protein